MLDKAENRFGGASTCDLLYIFHIDKNTIFKVHTYCTKLNLGKSWFVMEKNDQKDVHYKK